MTDDEIDIDDLNFDMNTSPFCGPSEGPTLGDGFDDFFADVDVDSAPTSTVLADSPRSGSPWSTSPERPKLEYVADSSPDPVAASANRPRRLQTAQQNDSPLPVTRALSDRSTSPESSRKHSLGASIAASTKPPSNASSPRLRMSGTVSPAPPLAASRISSESGSLEEYPQSSPQRTFSSPRSAGTSRTSSPRLSISGIVTPAPLRSPPPSAANIDRARQHNNVPPEESQQSYHESVRTERDRSQEVQDGSAMISNDTDVDECSRNEDTIANSSVHLSPGSLEINDLNDIDASVSHDPGSEEHVPELPLSSLPRSSASVESSRAKPGQDISDPMHEEFEVVEGGDETELCSHRTNESPSASQAGAAIEDNNGEQTGHECATTAMPNVSSYFGDDDGDNFFRGINSDSSIVADTASLSGLNAYFGRDTVSLGPTDEFSADHARTELAGPSQSSVASYFGSNATVHCDPSKELQAPAPTTAPHSSQTVHSFLEGNVAGSETLMSEQSQGDEGGPGVSSYFGQPVHGEDEFYDQIVCHNPSSNQFMDPSAVPIGHQQSNSQALASYFGGDNGIQGNVDFDAFDNDNLNESDSALNTSMDHVAPVSNSADDTLSFDRCSGDFAHQHYIQGSVDSSAVRSHHTSQQNSANMFPDHKTAVGAEALGVVANSDSTEQLQPTEWRTDDEGYWYFGSEKWYQDDQGEWQQVAQDHSQTEVESEFDPEPQFPVLEQPTASIEDEWYQDNEGYWCKGSEKWSQDENGEWQLFESELEHLQSAEPEWYQDDEGFWCNGAQKWLQNEHGEWIQELAAPTAFADVDLHENGCSNASSTPTLPLRGNRSQHPRPVSLRRPSMHAVSSASATPRSSQPHPIACFGFGGRLVLYFPRPSHRLNTMDFSPGKDSEGCLLPGFVRITSTSKLLKSTALAQQLERFPGPLTSRTTSAEINDMVARFIDESAEVSDQNLLWRMLRTLYDHKEDSASIPALLHLLDTSGYLDQDTHVSPMNPQFTPVSGTDARACLAEMEAAVLKGDLASAVDIAIQQKLYAHALVLSQQLSPAAYQRVVSLLCSSTLVEGSPLRTAFMLASHQPSLLFSAVERAAQHRGGSSQLLLRWRCNLAAILAQPASSERSHSLALLSDALLNVCRNAHASHCVFVASRGSTPPPILLGALTARDCILPEALQMSEFFEFSVGSSESLSLLPVYKLGYAALLSDVGDVGHALDYVKTVMEDIRGMTKQRREAFSRVFVSQLQELENRLKLITEGGGRAAKPSVVNSIFDRFSRLLIGNEEAAASPEKPVIACPPVPPMPSQPMHQPSRTAPVPDMQERGSGNGDPASSNGNLVGKLANILGLGSNAGPDEDSFPKDDTSFYFDETLNKWVCRDGDLPDDKEESERERVQPPPRPSRPSYADRSFARPSGVASRYALDDPLGTASAPHQATPARPAPARPAPLARRMPARIFRPQPGRRRPPPVRRQLR